MKGLCTRLRFRLALRLIGSLPVTAIAHSIAHELITEAQTRPAVELLPDRAHDAIVIGIETFWDLLNGEAG